MENQLGSHESKSYPVSQLWGVSGSIYLAWGLIWAKHWFCGEQKSIKLENKWWLLSRTLEVSRSSKKSQAWLWISTTQGSVEPVTHELSDQVSRELRRQGCQKLPWEGAGQTVMLCADRQDRNIKQNLTCVREEWKLLLANVERC